MNIYEIALFFSINEIEKTEEEIVCTPLEQINGWIESNYYTSDTFSEMMWFQGANSQMERAISMGSFVGINLSRTLDIISLASWKFPNNVQTTIRTKGSNHPYVVNLQKDRTWTLLENGTTDRYDIENTLKEGACVNDNEIDTYLRRMYNEI